MLLDRWIAEAMAEDHRRGIDHGSGLSSTGAVWCWICYRRLISDEEMRGS